MLLLPNLDEHSETPLFMQLYTYIKNEIIAGRIAEHTLLPSVRKFAEFLAISTTPVEMAYNQLLAEGFIESKPRSGYYVPKLTDPCLQVEKGQFGSSDLMERRKYPARDKTAYRYDFHLSKNDFDHFPFSVWRRLFNEILRLEQKELLFYGDPQGEQGLRYEIARYLHQFRGVSCSPEQIVIGAGSHVLLTFLSLLLKQHSTSIGVEEPGYPLIFTTFRQHGFQVVPISLEHDGIDLKDLYESRVRLVYVTPSHQFPQGMIMPVAKRLQLLEWAKQANGYIIEDDSDGEFRYHGRPVPSLQGLLPDTNVVYMGGFSKALAPAIRISYMVLPEALLDAYHELEYNLLFEQSSSPLHQKTLQLFMQRGYWEKHVRKMRNIYRKKHDVLVGTIQNTFQERAAVIGKGAGLHVLLRINSPHSERELTRMAKSAGIRISPASYTWMQPPEEERKEFFVGFGGLSLQEIEQGIKLLFQVWFGEP
ncbi:PLP-dependent aminotransferase family protein [Brevibacillus sp. H7]|uniref:MocR-like pyridoxine biosynthesis transcription factor PdxR n=1 Tax=Brevibacillus sp. H7 TaxID=3349138 RepID=UPI0037FC61D9